MSSYDERSLPSSTQHQLQVSTGPATPGHANAISRSGGSTSSVQATSAPAANIKPWYRRPGPWWIVLGVPIAAMAQSATIAPRVQIYTRLVCAAYRADAELGQTEMLPLDAAPLLPPPDQSCRENNDVLEAVARLITIMSGTMGILSCISTVWWGQVSDVWGRTRVMRIAVFGMFFAEFNFIVVAQYADSLPGGYYALILSSVMDGLLGGLANATSTMHAYVSDCVEPHQRVRIFSIAGGLMFIGLALGPWLGGRILHNTNDLVAVFFFASVVHACSVLVWSFVVPESLSEHVRRANKAARRVRATTESNPNMPTPGHTSFVRILTLHFLRPVKLLLPRQRDPNDRRNGRDWNLTFLVLAQAASVVMMGSSQFKLAYAGKRFGWDGEIMANWLSFLSTLRAAHLLVLLPLLLQLFKPKPPVQQREDPSGGDGMATSASTLIPTTSTSYGTVLPSQLATNSHPGSFDLAVARLSQVVEVIAFALAFFATTGSQFWYSTAFASFGGGFTPAVNALAVQLAGSAENGTLFGSLSVLQTLAGQVLGPIIFGLVFSSTVSWLPQAILLVSATSFAISLLLTMFIRLPPVTLAVRST